MTNRISAILAKIDSISDGAGKLASFLAPACMLVVVYEVAMRYAFNAPTVWAQETSTLTYAFLFTLGGCYVLRHHGHVSLDIVVGRLSPKVRAIIDVVLTPVLFFSFFGVLAWFSSKTAWASLLIQEHTQSPWGPPFYPVKISLAIGAALMLLQGVAHWVRRLVFALTEKEI